MLKLDRILPLLALLIFSSFSSIGQNYQDSLEQILNPIAQNPNITGFAVSIIRDGEVKYSNGFGLADESTRRAYTTKTTQNIASISKTFIGVSLMKAQAMGLLNLDDPIDKYLPYKIINPNFPTKVITIRHLAGHLSSLEDPDEYEKAYIFEEKINIDPDVKPKDVHKMVAEYNTNKRVDLDEFIKSIFHPSGEYYSKKNFLKVPPGEKFSYSNIGAGMAARIIEEASGKTFIQFTQEYIFDPLQMTSSTWELKKADRNLKAIPYIKPGVPLPHYDLITFADGGLITSIEDLSKYVIEMMNCYLGKGTLLTQDEAKEMMTPQLKDADEKYGIFWEISGTGKSIGHNGGDPGTGTNMYFMPSTGVAKIIFTNSPPIDKDSGEALTKAWRTMRAYELKIEN